MVLAAILWVCALPQTDDLGKFSAALKANGERQTLSVTPFDSTSRDSIVRAASPSAPELKVKAEAEPAALGLSAEPVQPVRATAGRPDESPRQRKVPVPDSGRSHAQGFAAESGTPYVEGLMKNRYVHRTFIMPTQEARELNVRLKLNPMRHTLAGKRVVLL